MNTPKINVEAIEFSEKSNGILAEAKKDLGFVPNMYVGMAGNTSLLDSYNYAYDSFRKDSGFSPVEQEVVFLSVSYFNNCEYCMAAHSFVGDTMTGVPASITDALRAGEKLPDPKLNSLSDFTKNMVQKRGWASKEDLDRFFVAGYSETHVLGVITGIALKTMSNYSNHLTKPQVDQAFTARTWKI